MKIKDILGEAEDFKIEPAPDTAKATGPDGKVIATGPTAALQAAADAGVDFTPSDQEPASEEYEDDPDLMAHAHNHDVSNDGTGKFMNDVRDAAAEQGMGFGPEAHETPEVADESIFGLGNKSPEEWAKTSKQMATLLQFQQKYQGTPYADQIAKRIALLKDRLDMDQGEVAGPGGTPKTVVPPEQFDMKQLREADNKLLNKMLAIAGLR